MKIVKRLLRFLGWVDRKPGDMPPFPLAGFEALQVDNALRETMRERAPMVIWRSDMNSMVKALRPDLFEEFESLYYGHPHKMTVFLDTHFSIAPDGWGVQSIAMVPTIFRKRFVKALD